LRLESVYSKENAMTDESPLDEVPKNERSQGSLKKPKNEENATKSEGKPKRSLKNFLINPQEQLRICGFYIGMISVMMISWAYTLYTSFLEQLEAIQAEVPNANIGHYLIQSVEEVMTLSIWHFIIILAVIFTFLIVLSHQFFGPSFALERFVKNLIEGDYLQRVHLRKNDQLKGLANQLNKLAELLDEKKNKG
jgi:methyl-accepting chemotaxis protein